MYNCIWISAQTQKVNTITFNKCTLYQLPEEFNYNRVVILPEMSHETSESSFSIRGYWIITYLYTSTVWENQSYLVFICYQILKINSLACLSGIYNWYQGGTTTCLEELKVNQLQKPFWKRNENPVILICSCTGHT